MASPADTSNQASRLTALRRTGGLSLHQVAEKLTQAMAGARRSHTTIQRYEKDASIRISRPVLAALATIYRSTPEFIEHGDVGPKEPAAPAASVVSNALSSFSQMGRLSEMEYVELPFIAPPSYGTFAITCQDLHPEDFATSFVLKIQGIDYNKAIVLEIRGNSMAPRYPEHSRHVVRPVSDGNWQYAQGVHAIALRTEMFVIKRIVNNQDGVLTLSSDNGGTSMTVLLGDTTCMWKVGEAVFMPAED